MTDCRHIVRYTPPEGPPTLTLEQMRAGVYAVSEDMAVSWVCMGCILDRLLALEGKQQFAEPDAALVRRPFTLGELIDTLLIEPEVQQLVLDVLKKTARDEL